MTIAVGDRLPDVGFRIMKDGAHTDATTAEIFAGRRVALFAVPGAYTKTCHLKHLPGFLDTIEEFKRKGIDTVACTAVNDLYVLTQWGKDTGADGRILMLADGNAAFAKAIGMESESGTLGVRSKRYAMLVEDGVVKTFNVEPTTGKAEVSSAEELLKAL